MAIVDYTQQEGDAGYRFRNDDGRELYLAGPEADEMARRIDSFRPPKTAQLQIDPGATSELWQQQGLVTDAGPGAGDGLPLASPSDSPESVIAQQLGLVPKRTAFGSHRVEAPPAQARAGAPANVPVPVGSAGQPGGASGGVDPRVTAPVSTPGVSRSGLLAQAAGAVPIPAGRSTTVERAGLPLTEQEIAAIDATNQNEVEVRRAVARERIAQSDLSAESARVQAADMRRQQTAEQADVEARTRATDVAWRDVQEAVVAAKSGKVDPQRFFGDKNFVQKAGIVFAKALGAFGASYTGGKNWAQESIDRMIDQDIAAQKDELDKLGSGTSNALAVYQRILGDEDLARQALRHTMQSVADAERGRMMSMFQSEETAQGAALWEAENAKARVREAVEFKNAGVAKIQTSTTEQFRSPSGGGARAPSLKEQAERARYIREIEGGYTSDRARQQAAQFASKQAESLATKLADSEEAYRGTIELAQQMGLTWDEESGTFTNPTGRDLAGAGLFDSQTAKVPGTEGSLIRQSLGDLVDLKTRARTGSAAPEGESEKLAATILGDGTEAAMVNGLNRFVRGIKAVRDGLQSGVNIDVTKQIESNRRDLQQHRTNKKLEAEEEPF